MIRGRVADFETDAPLAGVEIRLANDTTDPTASVTDPDGRFVLAVPGPGRWALTATRLGYARIDPVFVEVGPGEVLELTLRLPVEPVPLEEIVVVESHPHVNLAIERFDERRREGIRSGRGHFLRREDLARHGSARLTDVLRAIPGVWPAPGGAHGGQIVRMRGGCIPAVYLDGMQVNFGNPSASLDRYVATSDVEGVEVYPGFRQADGYRDPKGCGVVLVWTRNRSSEGAGRWSWTRWAVGLALITGILALR